MPLFFRPFLFSGGLVVSRVTLSRLGYPRQLKRAYLAWHGMSDGGQIGDDGWIGDARVFVPQVQRSQNHASGAGNHPICHCYYRPSGCRGAEECHSLNPHHQPIITNLTWTACRMRTMMELEVRAGRLSCDPAGRTPWEELASTYSVERVGWAGREAAGYGPEDRARGLLPPESGSGRTRVEMPD